MAPADTREGEQLRHRPSFLPKAVNSACTPVKLAATMLQFLAPDFLLPSGENTDISD